MPPRRFAVTGARRSRGSTPSPSGGSRMRRGETPELLAIADALADVLVAAPATRSRSKRWLPLSLAACLAAGAVVLAAALFVGGNVRHGIVDKALAAVGDGPVLHAVLREQLPPTYSLVELSTGRRVMHSPTRTVEVWF